MTLPLLPYVLELFKKEKEKERQYLWGFFLPLSILFYCPCHMIGP